MPAEASIARWTLIPMDHAFAILPVFSGVKFLIEF